MIDSLDQAVWRFKNSMPPCMQVVSEEQKNDYARIVNTTGGGFCITLKRDFYKSFKTHFKDRPEIAKEGWGQVANKRLIAFCANYGLTFVAVMPDAKIYAIDAKEFIKYYLKHKTDVPHLEGEIACPLHMFRRLYP